MGTVNETVVSDRAGADLVGRRFTRRRLAGLALGGALVASAGLRFPVAAQDVSATGFVVRTTAAVNLRSGPGTTYSVLLVIPEGAGLGSSLTVTEGFQNVSYNGTTGWVSREYLVNVVPDPASSRPDPETQYTGTAKVETAVNFRAGASTSAPIDFTMATGTVVETSGLLRNGFRACRLNGLVGWVIDGALVPVTGGGGATPPPAGGTAGYTNTDVNFRMDPSYGNNVIRVLPVNTVVTITGEASGEFIRVTTPGDIGWVFAAYVTAGTPPTSGGNPPPAGGGTSGSVTTALNLREQPSTGARILAVMPSGAPLTITGAAVSGFLPVIWNGLGGWAAAEYVRTGGGTPGGTGYSYLTTAALNLRAQPNANFGLLLVVPAGATVTGTGSGSAGYLGVSYNGTAGYVLAAYLVEA